VNYRSWRRKRLNKPFKPCSW